MSFHESGSNIEVEHGHILKAALRYGEDEERDAEIDLNDFIGNDDGGDHVNLSRFGIVLMASRPFLLGWTEFRREC
jgi:hypothetical protein